MGDTTLDIIHISWVHTYRYGIATFDWHDYFGPTPINRHTGEMRDYRNLSARWWADFRRWFLLDAVDREDYAVMEANR